MKLREIYIQKNIERELIIKIINKTTEYFTILLKVDNKQNNF